MLAACFDLPRLTLYYHATGFLCPFSTILSVNLISLMETFTTEILESNKDTVFLFGTNMTSSRVGIQEYLYMRKLRDLEEKIFCYGLVKIER